MGVEYFLVCNSCEEYIELHKAYGFNNTINAGRPNVGYPDDHRKKCLDNQFLSASYWEMRAIWFLWKHRGTGHDTELRNDCDDAWFELEPSLKEVYPHRDDLKLREEK